MKKELPLIVANATVNHFAEEFDKQEFNGTAWKEVQRRTPGTKAFKYGTPSSRNSAILVRTGTLRRALVNSKRRVSFDLIELRVTTGKKNEYAGFQNFGTDKIPKRQFVGQTPALTRLQLEKIKSYVNRIWQA